MMKIQCIEVIDCTDMEGWEQLSDASASEKTYNEQGLTHGNEGSEQHPGSAEGNCYEAA